MGIISVFTPYAEETAWSFTVNNAVDFVDIVTFNGSNEARLYGNAQSYQLATGDSFKILSYGVKIPDPYTLNPFSRSNPPNLGAIPGMYLVRDTNLSINDADFFAPVLYGNYELAVEQFIIGKDYQLGIQPFYMKMILNPQVSMLNVPASENGKTYYCYPWIKIEHTLPLV